MILLPKYLLYLCNFFFFISTPTILAQTIISCPLHLLSVFFLYVSPKARKIFFRQKFDKLSPYVNPSMFVDVLVK